MAEAALIAQAGAAVFAGLSGRAEAKEEQRRAEINGEIARTRALQTDTTARQGMESELSTIRAALGANNQRGNVGTLSLIDELRGVRNRERRIEVGNRMSEAADFDMAGKNAASRGQARLFGGFLKAGPSLFNLHTIGTRSG